MTPLSDCQFVVEYNAYANHWIRLTDPMPFCMAQAHHRRMQEATEPVPTRVKMALTGAEIKAQVREFWMNAVAEIQREEA